MKRFKTVGISLIWLGIGFILGVGIYLIAWPRTSQQTHQRRLVSPKPKRAPLKETKAIQTAPKNRREPASEQKKVSKGTQLYTQARQYLKENRLYEARKALVKAYKIPKLDEKFREQLEEEMIKLNHRLIFSPNYLQDAEIYIVKRGDTLWDIARRFKVTPGQIRFVNRLPSEFLIPRQRLKILKGRFSIAIQRSRFRLQLLYEGSLVKQYPIGVGKDDKTPLGTFKVTVRQKEPDWTYRNPETGRMQIIPYGDPRNILGDRWIGFNISGYGIHGTTEKSSIGKAVSNGCIRMLNQDVKELFEIIPIGTTVEITD
jgi:lipoprotein-anchoring transpeptidase ErfK/SrfK